ncbi:MAG: agmatine deiminase family protein [Myxococcota bacterium]
MPAATPASLGYRWPAEWEPHAATWLAWPHNAETWPERLEPAIEGFVAIVRELHAREPVRILVGDERMEESARRRLAAAGVEVDRVGFERIPTNDAWARDFGPIFLVRDAEREPSRRRALVDFGFDCWGRKYAPWDLDDAAPRRIAGRLGLRRFAADFVLEGGSVDGNGRGTVLTTESCLLNPNRGAGRSRESMERRLATWLGATQVVWLGEGIAGDDTDGHVDDVARFVAPGTVVAAVGSDANAAALAENLRRLRAARDQEGKPLDVLSLPMPPAHRVDGLLCPASYANFYLANGVALVPVFGVAEDAPALALLRDVLPGRDVVGIPCADLVCGLGAVHCLTQQEPA